VRSRQRWRDLYEQAHPLALPKAIHEELRGSARANQDGHQQVRHLWIVLSKEGLCTHDGPCKDMDTDMWLNLVDESAGLGVSSILISVGADLTERPELWDICKWGQETHDMLVGLHLTTDLDAQDLAPIRELDPEKTFLFVYSARIERYRPIAAELGVRVFESDGLQDGIEQRHCTLPSQMACVGGVGKLYTCGLVINNDDFELGDARGDRVDRALTNDGLPHSVPAGTSNEPHRCDGCPPLMEDRMRKATGRE
jgi:hypothetical protein